MNWLYTTIILPNQCIPNFFKSSSFYFFYSYDLIIVYHPKILLTFNFYLYRESKKCHTMKVMWWFERAFYIFLFAWSYHHIRESKTCHMIRESFLLIKNNFLLVICRAYTISMAKPWILAHHNMHPWRR